nr:ankyrin repeat protein [Cedratvirus borely]
MHLSDLPVENLKNICSFLGGYSYVAAMVPYLRSCVKETDRINFITAVYERQDFALIYLYDLFPLYQNVKECIRPLVKTENLTILGWLLARKPLFLAAIGREAKEQGSYKILTWAMFHGYKLLPHAINRVVVSGNTKLYHHLYFLGHRGNVQGLAALYGHLDILYEVEDLDPRLVSEKAAEGGHLHILQWLREKEILDKRAVIEGAVKGLQRKVILWLGEEADFSSCFFTCISGSEEEKIDFLEWLEERTQINYNAVAYRAACRGYIKVVRWCAEKARLDRRFFPGVCRKGTREDLEFFSSLGYYAYDKGHHHHAFQTGNIDALLWLDEQTGGVYKSWTAQNGFPSYTTEESNIACLEWLVGKGISINPWLLQKFIGERKSKVFAWLMRHVYLDGRTILACLERCVEVSCAEIFALLFKLDLSLSRKDIMYFINSVPCNEQLYNPLFIEEVEKLLG